MPNTKTPNVNLAELIRHIQQLSRPINVEETAELNFFMALQVAINKIFIPGEIRNLVPIHLKGCPIEKAKEYAAALGFQIVEGSGQTYLSWSKGVEEGLD